MNTLNEMSQLRDSGFGQPDPKHGLRLLYWFAHDYVNIINGYLVPKDGKSPKNKDFGFHKFQNRIEDDEHIVPLQDLPYYEVGNLNATGADKLPPYVRVNPSWNTDRIIVRLDKSGHLNRVYVTEHSDQKQFDKKKTYRVSQGLLQIIKNMDLQKYLLFAKSLPLTPQTTPQPAQEDGSWCTIL